jgi:hypothetical protein
MFAQRGTVMDARRRTWLIWLASGWFVPAALIRAAVAQDGPRRVIEARIENRKVVAPSEAIRITEGDVIELRWTSDEAVDLHLLATIWSCTFGLTSQLRWSSRLTPPVVSPSPVTAGGKAAMATTS